MPRSKGWTVALVVSDLIAFNLSFLLAYWLRFLVLTAPEIPTLAFYLRMLVFGNVLILLMFPTVKLYQDKRTLFDVEEFSKLAKGLALSTIILTSATFLTRGFGYSRLIIFFTFLFAFILMTFFRYGIRRVQAKQRTTGKNREPVLIIGAGKIAKAIRTKIDENPELGYRVMDIVSHHSLSGLRKEIALNNIKTIFIESAEFSEDEIIRLITKFPGINFKIVPNLLHVITGPVHFDEFKDIPLIDFRGESGAQYEKFKRVFDMIVASLILILFSPLLLIIAVLIKATSRGPIIFKQTRLGKDKKPFSFYKFRTMVVNAESLKKDVINETEGHLFKIKNDPRVTTIGRFLRRTAFDEFPQFVNVLKGDMSIVGPRPHIPEEMNEFQGWKEERFTSKPGITGMWQIGGRHNLHFDKAVMLDLYYIKHRSFLLDLEIILKTIPAILFSRGRW
jgi:exopolysaccharide biosynthesis polyprenyl glycosylphosphotransferase